jgi:DNA-binding GntR family transcriptional regulator
MKDSEAAYEQIKMAIITNRLRANESLTMADLMERFKLGRTPIREGLNRLAYEGFIKIIPRQCVLVNELSYIDLESIFQIRLALNPLESKLAVLCHHDEDLELLRQNTEDMRREEDEEKRLMLDRKFHQIIAAMTQNVFLERELNNYQDLTIRLIFQNKQKLASLDSRNIKMHEAIYDYIAQGDVENLTRIQRQHIEDAMEKFSIIR